MGKLRRLVKYLDCTRDLHLILRYDGLSLARWYVDVLFAVHDDFKSQSGGALTLLKAEGDIASGSNKQKLNTHSSTKAELVASDDFLPKILWTGKFMSHQGYEISSTLFQYNKSSMILEKRCRSTSGKQSRAINVHFFVIKDSVEKGDLEILHCPTEKMVGDFFMKPLQGSKFQYFRNVILGGQK